MARQKPIVPLFMYCRTAFFFLLTLRSAHPIECFAKLHWFLTLNDTVLFLFDIFAFLFVFGTINFRILWNAPKIDNQHTIAIYFRPFYIFWYIEHISHIEEIHFYRSFDRAGISVELVPFRILGGTENKKQLDGNSVIFTDEPSFWC